MSHLKVRKHTRNASTCMNSQKLEVVQEFTYLIVSLGSTGEWKRQREKYKSKRHTNIKSK